MSSDYLDEFHGRDAFFDFNEDEGDYDAESEEDEEEEYTAD